MTKKEAYQFLDRQGRAISFLTNVIMTQHSNPAKKMKGLVYGIKNGHSFRIADFHIDVLIMDDTKVSWSVLEDLAVNKGRV